MRWLKSRMPTWWSSMSVWLDGMRVEFGLELTGTLGVLLKAKAVGLVPSIAPLIDTLRLGGIRLSDAIVAEALRIAGETTSASDKSS